MKKNMRKNMKKSCASLKPLKTGVGSISQRYRSGDLDPDPHENVTDPQHWLYSFRNLRFSYPTFLHFALLKKGTGSKELKILKKTNNSCLQQEPLMVFELERQAFDELLSLPFHVAKVKNTAQKIASSYSHLELNYGIHFIKYFEFSVVTQSHKEYLLL
jgi:hypothetical protein